jgi:AcrR family transcriptional regulator
MSSLYVMMTWRVIRYARGMSRWAPDAALRLETAALELFAEQGYAATTVPQITARAGLTTRTFFRHFADKREVLFLREREFPTVVSTLLAQAPPGLPPIGLTMFGFEAAVSEGFAEWRPGMLVRRDIIRSDGHLRERELLKSSMLADAVATALAEYDVPTADAVPLARYGVLLFDLALDDWLDGDDARPLLDVLRETRARMHRVTASTHDRPPAPT